MVGQELCISFLSFGEREGVPGESFVGPTGGVGREEVLWATCRLFAIDFLSQNRTKASLKKANSLTNTQTYF